MATDGRRITATDVLTLTLTDIRHLSQWCDRQWGMWWQGSIHGALTVAQILAVYHAANDAGYAGMDEWHSEQPNAASDAYLRIAMPVYYTVVIPPAPEAWMRTEWHAPDATLTRGAFRTPVEANDWALTHLGVAPYSVRDIDPAADHRAATDSDE